MSSGFLLEESELCGDSPWQSVEEAAQLKMIIDADWGGDERSRKSAS